MPFVQLTGNARTHGFVTGNPERHGGLQGYCDRKENEVDTVWGIPDAQSSPVRGIVAGEGSAPASARLSCPHPRGWPRGLAPTLAPLGGTRAPHPHLVCVCPAGAHACDPPAPHGHPQGRPPCSDGWAC